jgi:CheY-like chemotaxis protein
VLVVDNDPHCAQLLASLVMSLGHTAELADDGQAGLERAKHFQPDIIFWTLDKPAQQARDRALALELRNIEQLRHTRLVALASWRDNASGADSAFHVHLARPVRVEEIDLVIRSM